MALKTPKSAGDWNPPIPTKGNNDYMKLLDPTAKDNQDALNGTNELKNFVGGKGTPSGDLGSRGRDF